MARPVSSLEPLRTKDWSEAVRVEMDLLFRTCEITDPKRFAAPVARCKNARNFYASLGEDLGGIPWWFIACIHEMESGGNFTRHLHNGDPLSARTVNVPAGRPEKGEPPFTFRASAIDALKMKGFDKVDDWSIPHALWLLERYNGLGYRLRPLKRIFTPYLWSGTNHYKAGKFVRDGVYDAAAVSKQAGCAGMIKILLESAK